MGKPPDWFQVRIKESGGTRLTFQPRRNPIVRKGKEEKTGQNVRQQYIRYRKKNWISQNPHSVVALMMMMIKNNIILWLF